MVEVGRVSILKAITLWVLTMVWVATASAQEASVRAQLSQASIAFGDSVSLTVTATNLDEAIDLSSLDALFTVTGRSSSREVRILNGVRTSIVNWVITIEPKKSGVLTVPPIAVGQLQSRALALNVGNAPTGNQRDLFIEATVDTDSPPSKSGKPSKS